MTTKMDKDRMVAQIVETPFIVRALDVVLEPQSIRANAKGSLVVITLSQEKAKALLQRLSK